MQGTITFVDPALVADRVQTPRCLRLTRLMILDALGVPASSAALLQLELNTENRQHLVPDRPEIQMASGDKIEYGANILELKR
eukprot:822503-Pyramimonas_sp.AAC.1